MGESLGRQILDNAVGYVTAQLDRVPPLRPQPPALQDLRYRIGWGSGSSDHPHRDQSQPSSSKECPAQRPDSDPSDPSGKDGIPSGPGRTARKNQNKRAALARLEAESNKKDAQIEQLQAEVKELRELVLAGQKEKKSSKKDKKKGPTDALMEDNSLALLGLGEDQGMGILDSHFHLDRLNRANRANWTPLEVTGSKAGQLLDSDLRVDGGVMVFCDPSDFPNPEEIRRLKSVHFV